MKELSEKVFKVLHGLELEDAQITIHPQELTVMARIISRSFSGMNEVERQRRVWEALRLNLSDREHALVEFVFTYAPEELEPVDEAVG